MIYMNRCRRILHLFGALSGLQCLWEQTQAAFIPEGPPPMEFWLLSWQWEESLTSCYSTLGFPHSSWFFHNINGKSGYG